MHQLFVYGTLKTNEPNHHVLTNEENGRAIFVSRGQTVEKFPLLIGSRYNVPYVLYKPGMGNRIRGEIVSVDDDMFDYLDFFENYPTYYTRKIIDIERADGQITQCWIYLLESFKEELLSGTFYADYSSSGDHGLQYRRADVEDVNHSHYSDVKPSKEP